MKQSSKKIMGAVTSCIIASLFSIIYLLGTFILYINDDISLVAYILLSIIFGIPLVCLIISLVSRIKEIKSHEEEDASIY